MNKYTIEILAEKPPKLHLGELLAGGEVIGIKYDEPDFVTTAWLTKKTNLSRTTINERLKPIAQGTGKFTYPRLTALEMLKEKSRPRGRPRKN